MLRSDLNTYLKKKKEVEPFKELFRRTRDYDESARMVFGPMIKDGLKAYNNI